MLIQERYLGDTWKMMVCCIFLNLTTRTQLEKIVNEFFMRWPDADAFLQAKKREVIRLIKPLGLYNRRYKNLKGFSEDFSALSPSNIPKMRGIGRYASDCYKLMCLNDLSVTPNDHALREYRQRRRLTLANDSDA